MAWSLPLSDVAATPRGSLRTTRTRVSSPSHGRSSLRMPPPLAVPPPAPLTWPHFGGLHVSADDGFERLAVFDA